jgi:dTDP-4-dehydrorhamnose 3,5-epimerase
MLPGAKKDHQSTTADWDRTGPTIADVKIKRTRHVVTANGTTTETYRRDWLETGYDAGHVIHVALSAGRISAWHAHELQTDGIFVVAGRLFLALYDARSTSPTYRESMILRLDADDPTLVLIPPLIWHGLKPLVGPTAFLNIFNRPYNYEDPDVWRLPVNTDQIPFDIVNAY